MEIAKLSVNQAVSLNARASVSTLVLKAARELALKVAREFALKVAVGHVSTLVMVIVFRLAGECVGAVAQDVHL